jgi:SpoVK/Ycf46/Vps4 family AAA+-type ATPase
MDILRHLLIGVHHSLTSEEVESVALATHGFVGADLAAVCNEAALSALRRYISLKENPIQQLGHPGCSFYKCNSQDTEDSSSLSSSFSQLTMSSYVACMNGGNIKSSESYDDTDEIPLYVTNKDFDKAKTKVRPSAMREVSLMFTCKTLAIGLFYDSSYLCRWFVKNANC